MDSREVNEIIVKLLAAADKIGGRSRDEVLYHIGRLSHAATRERTTAVDEMHYLDRKIRQLQDELRRLEPHNALLHRIPIAPASQARPRPMVSLHTSPMTVDTISANTASTGWSLRSHKRQSSLQTTPRSEPFAQLWAGRASRATSPRDCLPAGVQD